MGKVVLIVFIALIGFGAYWFYWEDGGNNAPITIEYDVSIASLSKVGNSWVRSRVDGDINLYMTPNKCKLFSNMDYREGNKKKVTFETEAIIRLDEKKIYLILPEEEIYCEIEFDFVPMSQTKKADNDDFDWSDVFDITVDGKWFGDEKEQYFARKHIFTEKRETAVRTAMEAMKGSKLELWFTDETRLGKAYVKGINKLLSIEVDFDEFAIPGGSQRKKSKEKRPQREAKDLPYFPIPLEIYVNARHKTTKEAFRMQIGAKKFSRKKLSKSTFNVPSDYKKVSMEKFIQTLFVKMMS